MKRIVFLASVLTAMLVGIAVAPAWSFDRKAPPMPQKAGVVEAAGIRALLTQPEDVIRTHPVWDILKWHSDKERLAGVKPYAHLRHYGNLLTTVGATYIWQKVTVTGGPPQTMDAAHTRLLSDNSATAATAGDTNSSATAGAANQFWQQASSVTLSTSTATIVGTFGSSDGNFAWQSLGIEVGANATASSAAVSAGGILMTHKVVSSGTKSSPASWQLTVTVQLGP